MVQRYLRVVSRLVFLTKRRIYSSVFFTSNVGSPLLFAITYARNGNVRFLTCKTLSGFERAVDVFKTLGIKS